MTAAASVVAPQRREQSPLTGSDTARDLFTTGERVAIDYWRYSIRPWIALVAEAHQMRKHFA
jgi:hypothetical protein